VFKLEEEIKWVSKKFCFEKAATISGFDAGCGVCRASLASLGVRFALGTASNGQWGLRDGIHRQTT
jgi:hypothetical protein